MPGMSASGESVSTSVHASSACGSVPGWTDARRAACVGYTRRLDSWPHFDHWTWSTYGGPGTGAAVATGARARSTVTAATAAATATRTQLAGLALDVQDLGPYVNEIDARRNRRDRDTCDAEHQGQQHADAQNHQPDRLGQLFGGGIGVRALHRSMHERVHRHHQHGDLHREKDVNHNAL